MSLRSHRVQRAVCLVALVLVGTAVAPVASATEHAPSDPSRATEPGVYLVTLTGRPAAVHPSTRPAPGRRFDRTRPAVADLVERLRSRQDQVLASVGDPAVLHRYTTAINGFAARLDESQVKTLRADPRVVLVERSTLQRPASDAAGPLDVSGDGGAWDKLGGASRAGRGVVVGLVDTGIWPENPSFAGLPQQAPGTSAALPGFHGACLPAERWSAEDCNDKVVSARWFVAGFGVDRLASTEMLSARDSTGHGSHAASTVAGERQADVRVDGHRFGEDAGMAPAARLAVYKACWTAPDPADDGCATADTVAAVDRAVADGVDVLSYSVTGSADTADTVSRAFLAAATAGVFVATAAGNAGPEHATVGHAAPWVTTVGASTHRVREGVVRLGDGTSAPGAMASDRRVPEAPLVRARDAAADGASITAAARCETGSLDAGVVQDALVVCDRGVVPRVDKSAEVARAGGVGMVLVNPTPDTVDADVHEVPTVHLSLSDAAALRGYLRRTDDPRATLVPEPSVPVDIPEVAAFSARGPVPGADLLKPDLTAPGVAVLGAVATDSDEGRLWDLRSGTSVSATHVAGLAALLRAEQQRWSPARIRSAMMTTADDLGGSTGPFAEGAGQIDPDGMLDPGLVLDVAPSAFRRFLAGDLGGADLNLPSLAVDELVGSTTVVRRLTNVSGSRSTYAADVSGLDGIEATVRPSTVTLRPGQTRRVRVTLVATPATPVREHVGGRLTWTSQDHQVRMPVVVRAAAVQVPEVVDAEVDQRRVAVRGRTGTGTPVAPQSVGLAAAEPVGLSLRPGPFTGLPDGDSDDSFATTVTVSPGAEAARFEIGSHNLADDLDLRVYRGDELVGESTGPAAAAVVTLLDPVAGDYRVVVHAVRAGNGAVVTAELSSWVVAADGADELEVETERQGARPGAPFRYSVSWDELDPTRRWFGVVRYPGSDRRTLIRIG